MWEFFKILKGKNTKLVLYTYDSFLFDFDLNEKDIKNSIVNVFHQQSLNFKIKSGSNYNF
jgi:hypothetical protein